MFARSAAFQRRFFGIGGSVSRQPVRFQSAGWIRAIMRSPCAVPLSVLTMRSGRAALPMRRPSLSQRWLWSEPEDTQPALKGS